MFSSVREWFSDGAGFAVAGTLVVIAGLGFGGPAVASAISDATAEGYTGTGIILEHHVSGSFCNVTVELDKGTLEVFTAGPRPVCTDALDGKQVTIDRGRLRK